MGRIQPVVASSAATIRGDIHHGSDGGLCVYGDTQWWSMHEGGEGVIVSSPYNADAAAC